MTKIDLLLLLKELGPMQPGELIELSESEKAILREALLSMPCHMHDREPDSRVDDWRRGMLLWKLR